MGVFVRYYGIMLKPVSAFIKIPILSTKKDLQSKANIEYEKESTSPIILLLVKGKKNK